MLVIVYVLQKPIILGILLMGKSGEIRRKNIIFRGYVVVFCKI